MPNRRRQDPKLEALRERGTLNPKPEGVLDQLFRESEFFDARDLVQVKYEMIRRVDVEGAPVAQAAHAFGFSRPSFYEAQAAFSGGGLPALLPKKRGPRGAHKLGQEVLAFIEELRAGDSTVAAPNIVQLLKERFGLTVHRRSVERALVRGQRTDKAAGRHRAWWPKPHSGARGRVPQRWRPAMEHLGIDVHKVESQICILTESGEVVERRIRTQRERFAAVLGERPRAKVLIEASTESEWVARCLEEL